MRANLVRVSRWGLFGEVTALEFALPGDHIPRGLKVPSLDRERVWR